MLIVQRMASTVSGPTPAPNINNHLTRETIIKTTFTVSFLILVFLVRHYVAPLFNHYLIFINNYSSRLCEPLRSVTKFNYWQSGEI